MCTRKLLWEPRNRLNEDRLAGWSNEPANWIVDWLSPLSTSTELHCVLQSAGLRGATTVVCASEQFSARVSLSNQNTTLQKWHQTADTWANARSILPSRKRQRYFTHHTSYADKATQLEEATTEGIRDGAGGGQHRKLNNTPLPAEPPHSSWRKGKSVFTNIEKFPAHPALRSSSWRWSSTEGLRVSELSE